MDPAILTLIIIIITLILFVTEKVPIAITALASALCVYFFGIIDRDILVGGFTNEVVLLFAAMFIIGGALFQTGVAAKIGGFIGKFAKTETQLLVVLMIIAAGFSAFLSNTSTIAVMLPIAILVADQAGYSRSKLLMPMAFAASFGGLMTLIGTTGNLAVQSVMIESGIPRFSFFEFGWIGIPLSIIGIVYMTTIGKRLLPDLGPREISEEKKGRHYDYSGWNYRQVMAVGVLLLTVFFMMFEGIFGIPLYITAMVGAVILIITRVVTERQAFQSLDLSTLLLMASMIPVAAAIETSGLGQMIADLVVGFLDDSSGPRIILAIIFVLTVVLGSIMSNTATALLMAPIAILIALNLEINPEPLLMTVAVAAACSYLTPISTPPNTMVYVPGNYTFLNYTVAGLPLMIIQFIATLIMVPFLWPM